MRMERYGGSTCVCIKVRVTKVTDAERYEGGSTCRKNGTGILPIGLQERYEGRRIKK
jgi:hypothetical protein